MRRVRFSVGLLPIAFLACCSVAHSASSGSASAMTYNVLYDGADNDASLDAIAAADPDIVCLQEVTVAFVRAFEKRLATKYPARRFEARAGTWGIGIASKHAIVSAQVFAQSPHRMPAMQAVVNLRGRRVTVACVHLFPPVAKRRKEASLFEAMDENAILRVKQAKAILVRFAKTKRLLVLGDMNEGESDKAVASLLAAGLHNACDVENESCGATFPGATSAWPAVFQIDHIFGRGLKFEHARVIRAGGSDHFPVYAKFHF